MVVATRASPLLLHKTVFYNHVAANGLTGKFQNDMVQIL